MLETRPKEETKQFSIAEQSVMKYLGKNGIRLPGIGK
jgi:hypothetical protein